MAERSRSAYIEVRKSIDINRIIIYTLFDILEFWQQNKDTDIPPITKEGIIYISKYLAKKYKIEISNENNSLQ